MAASSPILSVTAVECGVDLSDPTTVEIRLLGPLVVYVGSDEVSIGGPVRRAILLRLALNHDLGLDASRLSDAVWGGDQVSGAANRLQAQIALLRRTLGPDRLLTDGSSYRLGHVGLTVDSEILEAEVAEGRAFLQTGEPLKAVGTLRSALARWRGPPLIDVATYDWAAPAISYLTELHGLAHEALLESLLAVGLFGDVVIAAEQAIAEHPLRESLWRSSMLALAQAGRTAESARVFQRFRSLLREEVGLDPSPELAALDAAILSGSYSPTLTIPRLSGHDAATKIFGAFQHVSTPMIGRGRELDEISRAVVVGGLITLVGAGGVGKTRIAVAVANNVAESFPDGVWFVDLTALTESAGVAAALCQTIGLTVNPIDALDQLRRSLSPTRALVVLDNCEHVLDGAAQVAESLGGATAGLCLLATSREPLAVGHEIVHVIRPLPVGEVGSGGAVDLFLRHAEAHGVSFDHADVVRVAEICRRLDGLPLAIELAASRVRTLGTADLLDMLSERLDGLRTSRKVAKRHRTLRAAVEWSFDLLDERQQVGFALLSVFSGGFDVRAAQFVLASEGFAAGAAVDLLVELVDKSMVEADTGGSARRFRLLDSLCEYAAERLNKLGPTVAKDHHAGHYAIRMRELHLVLRSPQEKEATRAFLTDYGNIRSAFEWSLSRDDIETAAGIAEIGWEFGYQRMDYEAFEWVDRVYEAALQRRLPVVPVLAAVRAIARWFRSEVPEGLAWIDEAYRLADELSVAPADRVLMAEAQLLNTHDPQRSLTVTDRLAIKARGEQNQHVEAWALWMGAIAEYWKNPRTSLEPALLAVEFCRPYGQPTAVAASLLGLAMAYSFSDPQRALTVLTEADSIATGVGSAWTAAQLQLTRSSIQAGLAKGASREIVDRAVDEWVEHVAMYGSLSMRWQVLVSVAPLLLLRSPEDVAVAVGIFRARHVDDHRGSWARGVDRAILRLGSVEFERHVEHGRMLSEADAIAHLRGHNGATPERDVPHAEA